MGTLKHRSGNSLGDIVVPSATADEGAGLKGSSSAAGSSGSPALSPAVLLCMAVASMGAICFGYHLGVVNGPLEALSQQLGFGGDAFLQGLVRRSAWALLPGLPTRCCMWRHWSSPHECMPYVDNYHK
jgi:hypothetical protein